MIHDQTYFKRNLQIIFLLDLDFTFRKMVVVEEEEKI